MVVFSHLGVFSLKKNFVVFPALVLGMAAMVHAQTSAKVAIINVQNAILQTKDGQKAAGDLQGRFKPQKDDLDAEQGKIMQELGNKVMAVLEKFATANGYALVLDVSNPQTPVLWASQTIDITSDIVKLYDQANPGTSAPGAAKPPAGAAPVAPRSATPPAPAPKKK